MASIEAVLCYTCLITLSHTKFLSVQMLARAHGNAVKHNNMSSSKVLAKLADKIIYMQRDC